MKVQNIRLKMVRENIGEYSVRDFKVSHPITVAEVIEKVFDLSNDTQEKFGVICLDTKNKIIGMDIVTTGSLNSSIVHPRDILQRCLFVNANSFIVFHNHPSGDTKPSDEDLCITRRLVDAGKIIGCCLLDHIIIGDDEFLSMRVENLVEF